MTEPTNTTIKKARDEFWFDNIAGRVVNSNNLEEIAEAIGGKVEAHLVTVGGGHGEIVVRIGDIIGVDQVGKWHIVRLDYLDTNEELRTVVIERKKATRSGVSATR